MEDLLLFVITNFIQVNGTDVKWTHGLMHMNKKYMYYRTIKEIEDEAVFILATVAAGVAIVFIGLMFLVVVIILNRKKADYLPPEKLSSSRKVSEQ